VGQQPVKILVVVNAQALQLSGRSAIEYFSHRWHSTRTPNEILKQC
jgi:hypothetical protein